MVDVLFLVSGAPAPVMLDMARFAAADGRRVGFLVLDRGANDITLDRALVTFPVHTFAVPYRGVSLRRILSLPVLVLRLARYIHKSLAPGGLLVTSTYDLLIAAQCAGVGRRYRIRHQVRDLHRLQLAGGLTARLVQAVERLLMRRVDAILVSAPGFASAYYARFFDGRTVLLENVPAREPWQGFERTVRGPRRFTVGFIGVIRYLRSLNALLAAVRRLRSDGVDVGVLFAGGGDSGQLACSSRDDFVALTGAYEYSQDITTLFHAIDLVYAVYEDEDPNCQLAMPNKFYEAIISKSPILVAAGTYLASEVERLGIGVGVPTGDEDALANVLREAVAGKGWYARARVVLDGLDASELFAQHQAALRNALASDVRSTLRSVVEGYSTERGT